MTTVTESFSARLFGRSPEVVKALEEKEAAAKEAAAKAEAAKK